jgi:methionyl-tRNA formyltransferase
MPRLAFLGTPDVAAQSLGLLFEAGFEIPLVVTQPDARRGRGKETTPSPVKVKAQELGIGVSHVLGDLADVDVDGAVVVAYGALIPDKILGLMPMVNLHFSLLPRWRGAAPLERAILAGDKETGVCVMEVVSELDAGGVYATHRTEIANKTLDVLRRELCDAGTQMVIDLLVGGVGGLPLPQAQVGEQSYAKKLTVEDGRLNFGRTVRENLAVVRLGAAYCFSGTKRLKILEATTGAPMNGSPGEVIENNVCCADGTLALVTVQPEGGKAMDSGAWLRGRGDRASMRLTSHPES